jgi:hypothetical protein
MKMIRTMAMSAVLVTMIAGTAGAQTPVKRTRSLSPIVGWLGIATMGVGGALMVPWVKGEDYQIFGQHVCVQQSAYSFDVQRGGCDTFEPKIKAGLITAAIGAGMTIVGFSKVTVSPQIGRQGVGATATVKW